MCGVLPCPVSQGALLDVHLRDIQLKPAETSVDAKDVLTAKVATINAVRPEATLSEAVSLLNEKNVGAILVLEDSGNVAGVLSERDVIRYLAQAGNLGLAVKTAELMTKDVIACTPDTSLDAAISAMTKRMIRHLLVMEGDRPLGLLSIKDALTYRLLLLEQGEEPRFRRWFERGRVYSLRE
jgi:signal-transduction protein with cAMP-binding, CBS, and nucleotidyltransferase domain